MTVRKVCPFKLSKGYFGIAFQEKYTVLSAPILTQYWFYVSLGYFAPNISQNERDITNDLKPANMLLKLRDTSMWQLLYGNTSLNCTIASEKDKTM